MAVVNCNNFQIGVYLSKALFRFAQIAQLRLKKKIAPIVLQLLLEFPQLICQKSKPLFQLIQLVMASNLL